MRTNLAALALLLCAALLRADVVVLVNGDRVSGHVVGKITRRVRLQTPYGALVIPADKVERIRRDDGSEELLNVRAHPTPDAPAASPPGDPRGDRGRRLLLAGLGPEGGPAGPEPATRGASRRPRWSRPTPT